MNNAAKQIGHFITAALLTLLFAHPSQAEFTSVPNDSSYPISLSPSSGEITQTFTPPANEIHYPKPDFILIQNVHCNQGVQYAISDILRQLDAQGFLPGHIAVEGAVGHVDITSLKSNFDSTARKKRADALVSQGEMTGAIHFALSEGRGELYGVENVDLYEASVQMFRRSYAARMQLSEHLNRLDEALTLLIQDPAAEAGAAILAQDVQVIRRLIDQHLVPTEIQEVMNRAIIAVDHLNSVLPHEIRKTLLKPVSAAVDSYALALLRDDALLQNSLNLRQRERQITSVIVAGGFHTSGLTKHLKELGYSFVVITPRIITHNQGDERQYVERILGRRLPSSADNDELEAILFDDSDFSSKVAMAKAESAWLAAELRKKLVSMEFSNPPIRDIFTAMDLSWLDPSIRLAMINERAQILIPPTFTSAKNPRNTRVF